MEHFRGEFLDIDAGDLCQSLRRRLVRRRAGGRTEHQSVGNNGRAQKSRNVLGNIQISLLIDLVHNGSRAAHRLIPEHHRGHCLQGAQAVMIDNLQDLRFVNVVHRLGFLVVIHQDQLLFPAADQIPAGDGSDILSLFVENRIISVSAFFHDFLDGIHHIAGMKINNILPGHQMFDGNGLIDQPGDGVGVVGRADDDAAHLLRQLLNSPGDLGSQPHYQAAGVHLNGAELILRTVSQNHQIVLMDIVFHGIRVKGSDNYPAFDKVAVLISHDYGSVQCLRDAAVLGFGLGHNAAVVGVHIGFGDIADGDKTFQALILRSDGKGDHILLSHGFPGLFHGNGSRNPFHLVNLNLPDLGSRVGKISGRPDAETLQHILCLFIDLSRPLCHKGALFRAVFDIRVGNGRADGIRIRIFMADNIDLILSFHGFSLSFGRFSGLYSS